MRALYTPKENTTPALTDRIDFGSHTRARSIDAALKTLTAVSVYSDYLFYLPVGLFHYERAPYRLARYVFLGPGANDEPVRIGIFAAVNGDEPEGTRAVVEFLLRLHLEPERARGYQIFVYPVCNPTGFEDGTRLTRKGHDVPQELWNGSKQPEAYYLERELGVMQFDGVVNLRSVRDLGGIHARVNSATLHKALAQPALNDAANFLPRDKKRKGTPDFPPTTVGWNRYEGGLKNPAELKPAPFEFTFETPRTAPPELQAEAMVAALNRIVAEYRPFLSSQQHI